MARRAFLPLFGKAVLHHLTCDGRGRRISWYVDDGGSELEPRRARPKGFGANGPQIAHPIGDAASLIVYPGRDATRRVPATADEDS